MFTELLNYDPKTIDQALRFQVASILQSRSTLLAKQANVAGLRARAWGGEEGLDDAIDLVAADLMKLRKTLGEQQIALLKEAVDVEGLVETLPAIGLALLQKFNVPVPVVLEALGVDIDAIKELVKATKELISDM